MTFAGIGENSFSVSGDEFSRLQILGGYILKAVKNLEEKEVVKYFDIADTKIIIGIIIKSDLIKYNIYDILCVVDW